MSERYDQYDGWAWLYDRTMGPEYGKEQFAVLERVLLPRLKPEAEVFDLCCGTGQLISHLTSAGFRVTGLDGSEEMLARAKINASDAEFVLEDARVYREPKRYDAAFSTSASLNHVPSMDDLRLVFENVCASLRDDGVFVFDLNHPRQLEKWWRGRALEGMIAEDCAWMVTPRYDAGKKEGAFRVTMYRRPGRVSMIERLKRPLYRLLSLPRFIGLRLKLIERFGMVEPSWDRHEIDFPVVGHDLGEVRDALEVAGFTRVDLQTIEGSGTIDDDHSAYFICSKKEVNS
jgi:SAM-dependent methyltransferase